MSELDPTQKSNAKRMIAAQSCTKLGDVLINPKTVLTWLLTQMGAGEWLVALLVPIRESGSMLPQIFISGWVKRFRYRKRVFVAGALAQAAAVATMGAVALLLPPTAAGAAILGAVALFAGARAFCSISSKDVVGRTIPKGIRGKVGGIAATISGVLSTIAALALIAVKEEDSVRVVAWIVLGASALWMVGAALYGRIDEPPGEPDDEPVSQDILARLRLLREDALFRRFIVARFMLLGSALASPLLVVLAGRSGGALVSLGAFVIAAGVATAGSSFLWGKLSDRASHLAMSFGGFGAALVGVVALGIGWVSPEWAEHPLVWPALFLLFNFGYAGVRLGRKTWIVDAAKGDRRTDYVSASNTVIAVAILVLGGIASPLQSISPLIPLAGYTTMCAAGGLIALGLNTDAE
jgi:hypothetical protein